MKVTPVQTHIITTKDTDILAVFNAYLPNLKESSVVAVTSKIVALCEGRVVEKKDKNTRDILAKQEAEYYLPREENKYRFLLTVKEGMIVASSGIDESNAEGMLVLWPAYPQESANIIREHLAKKFGLKHIGVIITDSRGTLMRWGTLGVSLAHSGFDATNDYRQTPDLFGRLLKVTRANVRDSLAIAAVAVMGEGSECTPLAVIEDIPFVKFQDRNPTREELSWLKIAMEDDLYASFLTRAPWKKGGHGKKEI